MTNFFSRPVLKETAAKSAARAKRCLKKSGAFVLPALLFFLASTGTAFAQTPAYSKNGGGTSANTIPLNTTAQKTQLLYTPTDFSTLPMSGFISKIYFRNSAAGNTTTYTNFKVSFMQNNDQSFTNTAYLTGLTVAYSVPSATVISNPTAGGWFEIALPSPYFTYDNSKSLIVEIVYTAKTGGISTICSTTTGITKRNSGTDPNATTGFLGTNWNDFGMDILPAAPCTAPPTAGTAVSTVATVCSGTNFTLSLTGAAQGSGLTYQWQSSPNGTTGWTDINGATNSSFVTTQTTTTYYRARLICSGQPAFSSPVQVTTNSTPVSGTFTIDKNSPATATNFTSFNAAISSVACRNISGPVVFNVVAGSGPYNEQVTIPQIGNASAANTLTINGNGNKLTFAPNTTNRHLIRLDGADFVTINDLQLETTDLTYGWGIHLQNGADNNTITNNIITIGATSTTESNSVGIVLANSTTVVTTGGNSGSNNLISGNTITGGYKGIQVSSVISTTSLNQVRNNTIKDFYADGIVISAATGTIVEGNDISRPARATVTTFTGIELNSNSQRTLISKNRIHNTHGGASSKTGTVQGIYFTSADAPVGGENIVQNNLLYDVNNTGSIYGLYNSASDGAFYYHNTLDLTNVNNTSLNRGFYQITLATNIKLINNIITINSGSSGAKHALYFSTITSGITSNNNVLLVNGGTTSSGIGYYSSNRITLADWRAASNQDAFSVSLNPQYSNAATGNFSPTNAAVNNIGQGVGVTEDINGAPRNPGAPDAGAYEFLNNANDVGITAITSPNSVCGLSAAEVITVILTNFGTNAQTNIPVSYTINGGTPVNQVIAGPLAPGATLTFSFNTTADLSAAGGYSIVAATGLAGDVDATNNAKTKVVTNAQFAGLPINLNFETMATGMAAMKTVTHTKSTILEGTGASNGAGSTKGMIMAGVTDAAWQLPIGAANPWLMNPEHLAGAYLCFSPAGGSATDSLWLTFDLKQLYKNGNINTNFRVTVNGVQEGPTFNPPFAGTPIVWQKVKIDLTAYKNLSSFELGFESSVAEEYANGAGTANLIDNINIVRRIVSNTKDTFLQSQLAVYPNPSAGLFKVELPQGKAYQLEITDLTGNVIKTQKATTGTNTLNMNGTAKGIYLLKVTSDNGIAVKKLIVE